MTARTSPHRLNFERQSKAWLIALLHLAVVLPACAKAAVTFYDDIKPLFSIHCYKCHAGHTKKGGLHLDTLQAALAGGKSGQPALVPGSSDRSALVRRITSADPDEQMPPKGPRLSAEQAQRIKQWIDAGAKWPERDDYWAFRPPTTAKPPRVKKSSDLRNPIDRFIQARLDANGIKPAAPADARILLRRAYADLLGVPPSPEEAEGFVTDKSPNAYEKLIDRLLDDPRYGERWARHWLDLARYGESDGYEDDKVRPHAWRYRDYVIRSFNSDKPYDRFVSEQIAGDELFPNDPDAWVATGFARLGSWD